MLSLLSKYDDKMTTGEFITLIEKAGWRFEREGKGSHTIYRHPDFKDPISIPYHGKKDLGKGLLNKLKKQAGLK